MKKRHQPQTDAAEKAGRECENSSEISYCYYSKVVVILSYTIIYSFLYRSIQPRVTVTNREYLLGILRS